MKTRAEHFSFSVLRFSTLILVAALYARGTVTGAQTVTFAEVMRRAHEYVTIYEDDKLSSIIARERYHQQVLDSLAARGGNGAAFDGRCIPPLIRDTSRVVPIRPA